MSSRNNIFRLMPVVLSLLGSGGCITNMCDNPWLMPVTIPLDVATSPVQLFGGMVFWCAMYEPEKWGSITVTGCDIYGQPITNAILHVDTCVHYGIRPALSDDYRHYEGMTDSKGKVTVKFKRRWQDVDWRLDAPDHYSAKKVTERPENKCKLHRSLKLYPKRNPQPMYAYGKDDYIKLPNGSSEFMTNGYKVVRYEDVAIDLKNNVALSGDDLSAWESRADFVIEEQEIVTNDVKTFVGKIRFAPGCGAYRCKYTGDASFPTTYAADVNMTYESEIRFSASRDMSTGKLISQTRILQDGEYMVLRTRKTKTEKGVDAGWHYSKVFGPLRICAYFQCQQSVFNPRLNDPNLELDLENNLARPRYKILLP